MNAIRSTLIALLAISPSLWAQTPADVPQTLEQANAQRERAAQMSRDADQRYANEQAECYKKILVNGCLADAKKRQTQATIESRNLDAPARDFQREAHRAEVAAKEAQRAADNASRETEQKTQAEQHSVDEAAKAAEREKKIADKEQKAIEGRQKLEAEQAKRQAKLANRAKQEAERAAKRKADEAKKEPVAE